MHTERIQLTDNAFTAMMKMADGNPGAATVIMQMIKEGETIDPDSAFGGLGAIMSLDSYGIYGTDIYVLHSDICDNDLPKTLAVLRAVQLGFFNRDTLKYACNQQDYSGKQLVPVDDLYQQVKKRLPNFNSNIVE